jgi:hypothetical protein
MTAERKARVIDIILNHADYSEDQWRAISDYNRDDVLLNIPLLEALAPKIDLPVALFRGRYARAVAAMEVQGLPVDVEYLRDLETQWQALRMFYIARDDAFALYDDNGSFCEDRFEALVKARGWTWPRTPTGRLALDKKTFG